MRKLTAPPLRSLTMLTSKASPVRVSKHMAPGLQPAQNPGAACSDDQPTYIHSVIITKVRSGSKLCLVVDKFVAFIGHLADVFEPFVRSIQFRQEAWLPVECIPSPVHQICHFHVTQLTKSNFGHFGFPCFMIEGIFCTFL